MSSPAPFGPITEQLQRSLNIRHVYGEPVQHGDTTVIPVAQVAYGFGAPEREDERWLLELAAKVCVFAGFRRRSFTRVLLIFGGRLLAWWVTPGADPRPSYSGRTPS
jgi:hypothetical protein